MTIWLSRDPIAEMWFELARRDDTYGDADSPNLYAFAFNSPANHVDGLGLSIIEPIEILSPPSLGGSTCPQCTPTGYTIYKSPQGRPVRRSCHYECSNVAGGKLEVTVDVGPKTPCPSGQDIAVKLPINT